MGKNIRVKRAAFAPTTEQREAVKWFVICGTLPERCRQSVIDPRTGRPISLAVFQRVFAHELATALRDANAAVSANLVRWLHMRALMRRTAKRRTGAR